MDTGSYQNGGRAREPDFQKLTQTIANSIQKISQNVARMERMVAQIGTQQDTAELRKQLHSIQHYTNQLVKDTNGYIKDLSNVPPPLLNSEMKQRKMQRERLYDEFSAILNNFQTVQRNTATKEKEQVNKAKAQVFGEPHLMSYKQQQQDQQLIELQDSTATGPNSGSTADRQTQLQEEADMKALREQEKSIRQLESDINDVNEIFKELGALVHEQGETIDSIEANVERTSAYVAQGAQQLRDAGTYKNKIRRRKFILTSVLAIVIAIILVIIVWNISS